MDERQEYIDKYKQLAVDTTSKTGLFPSVMLSQGIVESRNGKSELSQKYHNHFGIKADKSWTGKKVNLATREVLSGQSQVIGDYFRVYKNDKEGFRDRVKFLLENTRYQKAGVFSAKTPLEQIERLKSAGYATDPQYVEIVDSVLRKENLGVVDFIKAHPVVTALGFLTFGLAVTTTIYWYVNRKKIDLGAAVQSLALA
jgi:flagellum-specific peptidoglycan hydrolase FlgJ